MMCKADTIFYMVADLDSPAAEPFMVIRADTEKEKDGGIEATVVSVHWTRGEAQVEADLLNRVRADRTAALPVKEGNTND